MTDKVMIDGVDIAGCEYHSSTPSSELCYMKGNKCVDNCDCYYKQLQHQKQECEELKEKLDNIQDDCPSFGDCSYVQCAKDERDRYKQALEQIEKLAQENNDYLEGYHHEWANNKLILEIINEVKNADI